jgi:ELWxxDGT repeat protein
MIGDRGSSRSARRLRVESLESRRLLAVTPSLLLDINTTPASSASSFARYLVNVNGTLFFAANDGTHGEELWKSDGTPSGTKLVKDINPNGSFGGDHYFTNINGTLFFVADDGSHGAELWKSDGTDIGTTMVKDINLGTTGSIPRKLTNVNGTLFFKANDGSHGYELWKSNGLDTGTVMVKDISPTATGQFWTSMINVGGTLFFQADDGTHGYELWKSNGLDTGTVMVKDINPNAAMSAPQNMAEVNGTLFFRANDGTNGYELWKSNGEEAGTVLVKVLNATPNSSYPHSLTNLNGVLMFEANDATNGHELWRSDGTSIGTVLVKDIFPGASDSSPRNLINVGGTLFFGANDKAGNNELWKSDGTTNGTVLVKEINPATTGSYPRYMTNVDGKLYFVANDGSHGAELWRSGGTDPTTSLVLDIRPITGGTPPSFLTNVRGDLFFGANDGVKGWELWSQPRDLQPAIDIIPGQADNAVNLADSGLLEVAVLSSATFDATRIDTSDLSDFHFGDDSLAARASPTSFQLLDVNADNATDVVLRFPISALRSGALVVGSVLGELTGPMQDGATFGGTDSVSVTNSANPAIDILPGQAVNAINLASGGLLPVAVLGSATFDVSLIDTLDLTKFHFGDVLLTPRVSPTSFSLTDTNSDGKTDLLLQFSISTLGSSGALTVGSLQGQLVGPLLNNGTFNGTDSVVVTNVAHPAIDILPGQAVNGVNLASNGMLPVAVLSSDTFTASQIDTSSLSAFHFGDPLLTPRVSPTSHLLLDVNADGKSDLVLQFSIAALSGPLTLSSLQGELTGPMQNGGTFTGSDSVVVTSVAHPAIDILPGQAVNAINLASVGALPVAVLGSDTFNASQIDMSDLTKFHFGDAATAARLSPASLMLTDANADGKTDLVLQFSLAAIGGVLTTLSVQAELTGPLTNGGTFSNTDSVVVTNVAHPVIDILPGQAVNAINLALSGSVPVAVLGSQTFDVSQIDTSDLSKLHFGDSTLATRVSPGNSSLSDVNGDGKTDLVLQFSLATLGGPLTVNSLQAELTGPLQNGGTFSDADSVVVTNVAHPAIDILPGQAVNEIDLTSTGAVPIAVLGSDSFDVTRIDTSDLSKFHFGDPLLTPRVSPTSFSLADVNSDGKTDLLLQFSISTLASAGALKVGSMQGELTGPMQNGGSFSDSDALVVTGTVSPTIDIVPGAGNSIDLTSSGPVSVAILGADGFNASEIDTRDLQKFRFGDAALAARGSPQSTTLSDVNNDGKLDLVLNFSIPALVQAGALVAGTVQAELTGLMLDGSLLTSSSPVTVVVPETVLHPAIDIVPGKSINTIDLDSGACVSVAVMGSSTFDATQIDRTLSSLHFGAVGLSGRVSPTSATLCDINCDGRKDLVLTFSIPAIVQAGALASGSTQAELTGILKNDNPWQGVDSVSIAAPCLPAAPRLPVRRGGHSDYPSSVPVRPAPTYNKPSIPVYHNKPTVPVYHAPPATRKPVVAPRPVVVKPSPRPVAKPQPRQAAHDEVFRQIGVASTSRRDAAPIQIPRITGGDMRRRR